MHATRFPGWRVVMASALCLGVTAGFGFYGLGVYLNALADERGWNVSSISLATTVYFLVGGLCGLAVAREIARRDARIVMAVGGVVGGVGLALLGFVEARWQLFGAYAVMSIGWAMAGLVPATTLITRWYQAKRASALSIASTGLSVGGVVLTPIAKAMIDNHGLRATTPWLGLTWAAIIVPTAWWLLLPSPEAAGWLPDGERSVGAAPVKPAGVPYRQGVRTRFFVGVTAAYTLLLCSQVGGIQHLVRLFEERSTAAAATAATSVVAAASIVARLAGGQVVRRVSSVVFTIALGAVQAAALALLGGGRSTAMLMIATALFGITVGNVLMMQPLLIAERFGVADYPRLFSTSQAVTMIGTAGGPLLLGALRDGSGYGWAYTAAALLAGFGVIVLALGDRPDAMTTEAATVP